MKNIITELYYGNIDPQARGFKKDSYLQKQMSISLKKAFEYQAWLKRMQGEIREEINYNKYLFVSTQELHKFSTVSPK